MKYLALAIGFGLSSHALAKDIDLGCAQNASLDAICKIQITEVASSSMPQHFSDPSPIPWGDIINIGKEIWKVILDNKPVVNTQYDFATALPRGVQGADELDNWKAPAFKTFNVVYTNGLGMAVVDYTFSIYSVYGGNYNERGQYLADVRMLPGKLNVIWGYNFSATFKIGSIYNVGTSANPIAGMTVVHDWVVSTPLLRNEESQYFVVRGDGSIDLINGQ